MASEPIYMEKVLCKKNPKPILLILAGIKAAELHTAVRQAFMLWVEAGSVYAHSFHWAYLR